MLRHHSIDEALDAARQCLTRHDYDAALLALAFVFAHVARIRDEQARRDTMRERADTLEARWFPQSR